MGSVRFWDSSALVPLFVEEPRSKACRHLVRTDQTMVVWCLARTEILSALWRLRRAGFLSAGDIAASAARIEHFAERWNEIDAIVEVRDVAARLLQSHTLRAADALQLAAALLAVDHRPKQRPFVCADETLLAAAIAEGFDAIRPRA